jgi:hypothetical protein
MPYSLLVLTINFHILALCLGVDLITLPKPNLILSSVSATRNSQLLVFLLVSVTGSVMIDGNHDNFQQTSVALSYIYNFYNNNNNALLRGTNNTLLYLGQYHDRYRQSFNANAVRDAVDELLSALRILVAREFC